jgi:hypothetical protein
MSGPFDLAKDSTFIMANLSVTGLFIIALISVLLYNQRSRDRRPKKTSGSDNKSDLTS